MVGMQQRMCRGHQEDHEKGRRTYGNGKHSPACTLTHHYEEIIT